MKIEQFLNEESPSIGSHRSAHNEFDRVMAILFQMIEALGELKDNNHRKLNLTKLAAYLKITPPQLEKIITLVIEFQTLFNSTLKDHQLKPLLINKVQYLMTEFKNKAPPTFQDIQISRSEHQLFNDYIYIFRYVKKGQGVPLQGNSSFLTNLKLFYTTHPYLFLKNGDNLLYPSELGLKLGEILQSHLKCNKKIDKIEIEPYQFIFEG